MADEQKTKIVDGVVVEETVTGRMVKRDPELQHLPYLRRERQLVQELFPSLDVADIEQRIADQCRWAGALYDEEEEKAKAEALKPENRKIILTDEYE